MTAASKPGSGDFSASLSPVATLAVVAIACLALLGWQFDNVTLRSGYPGLTAMNPTTAVTFLLAALSFGLLRRRPEGSGDKRVARWLAQVCAAGVALVGVVKLGEYLLGWRAGIDTVLFRSKLAAAALASPNQIAPNTAVCFALLGLALLLLDVELGDHRPAEWLTLAAGLVAVLAVLGYAYGMSSLFGVGNFIPMALNSATAFVLLCTGILSARADRGLMRIFLAESLGGVLARRMFPAALAIPVLLGWLRLEGAREGLYDDVYGVALYATANVVIFAALLYWTAHSLDRADTERKAAREALERQAAELTRSNTELAAINKELDAFTYSVSHDLRSPLRQVDGFSRILEEELGGDLPDQARHCLERIVEGVEKMGRLVDDLLNLGRVGRKPLTRERTRLTALVRQALAELQPETKDRNIDWQIEDLPEVECDPGLMTFVFVNLLSNAVKFTQHQERAVIQVGLKTLNCEPVFFVRDNGIGFNMRYVHKLFGIFQRLHRQEDFQGTGVGLANAQRIIHKHGGRIWAEAEPYKGATFYFTLGAPERSESELSTTLGGGAWQSSR